MLSSISRCLVSLSQSLSVIEKHTGWLAISSWGVSPDAGVYVGAWGSNPAPWAVQQALLPSEPSPQASRISFEKSSFQYLMKLSVF